MSHLTQLFSGIGGQFISPEASLIEKLKHVKAFVFDWDGVFTNASKDANSQSQFNEADSMGVNLLRFSYFLNYNQLPITAIISGENNKAAFLFCTREKLHASYSKCANKLIASNHLCETFNLKPHEICFVFDDVLDNTYDIIKNNTERYIAVRKLLLLMQEQGVAELFKKCQAGVKHNQLNFESRLTTPLNTLLERLTCLM